MTRTLLLAALLGLGCVAPPDEDASAPEIDVAPPAEAVGASAYLGGLERAFAAEPVDGAWAPGAEAQLRGAAARASCRSALCRVELAHAPGAAADAQESFALQVSSLVSDMAFDAHDTFTIAFVARAGQSLPKGDATAADARDGERGTAEH